jgi:hypothetical protein
MVTPAEIISPTASNITNETNGTINDLSLWKDTFKLSILNVIYSHVKDSRNSQLSLKFIYDTFLDCSNSIKYDDLRSFVQTSEKSEDTSDEVVSVDTLNDTNSHSVKINDTVIDSGTEFKLKSNRGRPKNSSPIKLHICFKKR